MSQNFCNISSWRKDGRKVVPTVFKKKVTGEGFYKATNNVSKVPIVYLSKRLLKLAIITVSFVK